ncbi:MAG TPA: RNA polymerase sigma-70 factor [Balneolaceae bacterium]|nr:RNA polymerase sigma-70 factor [Balneolaceae bacterium]
MGVNLSNKEKKLLERIRSGDEEAFKKVFFQYYNPLCKYAMKIVKSRPLAQDAVQEVFMKIWKNHRDWYIYHSLKTYLYQAVRNQSLNLLEARNRHCASKSLSDDEDNVINIKRVDNNYKNEHFERSIYINDLVDDIWDIVEDMPERRRMAFTLHRKDGLSYKEIGGVMGIKRKTVENHIALVLKTIRQNIDHSKFENYRNIMSN